MLYWTAPATLSQLTVTWLSPAEARMVWGAPGGGVALGVAERSGDKALSPPEFTADTAKKYSVPLMRPDTVLGALTAPVIFGEDFVMGVDVP